MSCCPPAPQLISSQAGADEPTVGPEVQRVPGEPEACFARRAGNVSETGRVDDKTEPIAGKITQGAVVTDCTASINQTFTVTSGTVTEWVFEHTPAPLTGITFNSTTGRVSGTFDQSLHGKTITLRVKALNGATVLDDRTYTFSPAICNQDTAIRLAHPLPGSVITSGFGPRRPPAQGASSSHLALDFAYPGGITKDVFCSADGEVILARPGSGYGNYVMVKHSDVSGRHLVTTLYAHLDSIYVRVGQKVAMGQALGKEGNTGIGSGPHLHFEVRLPNGTKVDPTPFLKGTVTAASVVTPDNQPTGNIVAVDPNLTGKSITPEQVQANSGCAPFGPDYGDPAPPPAPPPAGGGLPPADPFEIAWFFVCRREVNPKWATAPDRTPKQLDPAGNQDIDDGLIETLSQRTRVGWVNSPFDPGGKTKFGVAQRHNPKVNVEAITYAQAREVAYNQYWLSPQMPCNNKSLPIAIFVMDCNYLFGPGGSRQIYESSGVTGSETGPAATAAIDALLRARVQYLNTRSPTLLARFGRGWLSRANECAAYCKGYV